VSCYFDLNKTNNPKPKKYNITGTHNGEVTHHHDQSILFVNFNPRNNRNSNDPNPIPLLLDDFAI
jgi:hypothetical protein